MGTADKSLRLLVEKWLGPTSSTPVRVTGFGRIPLGQRRYVCVETLRPAGALAIYFFRHDDGTWCVFPPALNHPAMGMIRHAA
ncbi:hypothetical protein CIC12_20250 [Burkholderia sp. SG-MS1]|nr:hypothetical protein [Paraburkholderia sp. SG-MS1]NKJ49024.1 hypothetical protein [Paraburkholderia sp. SG-MS1]